MYTPNSFANSNITEIFAMMERHSFATIVSSAEKELVATHMPLLLKRDQGPRGSLLGHLARANPQWKAANGQSVLCIFHGPHTYISPSWYVKGPSVPTWNYVAVHAYGTLEIVDDQDKKRDIVEAYVDHYEASMDQPWTLDRVEADWVDRLLDAIVGFTISIDRVEGKWKLNQNQPAENRESVQCVLGSQTGDNQQAIAELMAEQQRKAETED